MNEQSPRSIPMFTLRNEEGCVLDISAWGSGFTIKVWPNNRQKNERPSQSFVFGETMNEIREDAIEAGKAENGFVVSKMASKYDKGSKSIIPALLWTIKRDIQQKASYFITFEFPSDNKIFTFPFKKDDRITCTSGTENPEVASRNMLRRFIETFSPLGIMTATSFSKAGESGEPIKTTDGSTTVSPMMVPRLPDEDIPF